ncbi:2-oxoglutarate dehydrogenase E1 subunit family protein, partial [Mycobacterium montefiorense]
MSNISSPFGQNEWLVEEMYRKFRDDPSSVDPSWHEFLVDYNPEPTTTAGQDTPSPAQPPPAAAAPAPTPVAVAEPPAAPPAPARPASP